MRIVSNGLSDIGVKRERNEDSMGCHDDLGLYVVADGMGGHAAGEIASQTAVTTVADAVRRVLEAKERSGGADEDDPDTDRYVDLLELSVQEANCAICELSQENVHYTGMGTTLSGMLVRNGKAAIAHVGDSRIYRLREGRFEILTSDHSWVNEQLKRNIITPVEAKTHRWRNVITRALGNRPDLEVDTDEIELQVGDCYLLCSDGLTGMVEEEELAQVLSDMGEELQAACRDLVERANKAGGNDNVTLIILRVME